MCEPRLCSVSCAALAEHAEHAIRHQVAPHHVDGGEGHRAATPSSGRQPILRLASAGRKPAPPPCVMPEMALAPDMSGVCSVAGTFEMSSKPKKMDNTRMNAK